MLISEYIEEDHANKEEKHEFTPKSINAYLDRFVVGQKTAKRTLSVAMFNHMNKYTQDGSYIHLPKSNVLLIGDSGVGKTLLVEKLAELANIPFVIVDATTITQAGYSGDDVSTCLKQLLIKAGGDINKAQKGIVFIDEVDKIAAKSTSSGVDVSGRAVQQSLLKLIEGKDVPLSTKGIQSMDEEEVIFNTKDTLFIAGGAFEGLKSLVQKDNQTTGIGFVKTEKANNDVSDNISDEALIQFGMIPEFIGRYALRVQLDKLTEKDMFDIIANTEGGILHTYKTLFEKSNVSLTVDNRVIDYAVHQALKLRVGARAANRIIQPVFDDIIFNTEGLRGVEKIHLTLSEQNMIEYKEFKRKTSSENQKVSSS